MSKKHPPYAPEFRRQMIELVRARRTPEQLAKEFEPSAQAIRNWVAQADRNACNDLAVAGASFWVSRAVHPRIRMR
jgi:transposase-like protein